MSHVFPGVTPPMPTRGAECPSALELETHVGGQALPSVLEHLATCEACGAYCAALEQEQEAFRREARPAAFVAELEEARRARSVSHRWRRALGGLLMVAAASSAALLLVLRPERRAEGLRFGLRFKGGSFSTVYLRGGMDEPRVVEPSMHLRPGDALRFFYRAKRPGQLAILDRDGRGTASALFPFGGAASSEVHPEETGPLPGTMVLDEARGPEYILAVFCPRAFQTAPLLASLRGTPLKDPPRLEVSGCEVETLRIEKDVP